MAIRATPSSSTYRTVRVWAEGFDFSDYSDARGAASGAATSAIFAADKACTVRSGLYDAFMTAVDDAAQELVEQNQGLFEALERIGNDAVEASRDILNN